LKSRGGGASADGSSIFCHWLEGSAAIALSSDVAVALLLMDHQNKERVARKHQAPNADVSATEIQSALETEQALTPQGGVSSHRSISRSTLYAGDLAALQQDTLSRGTSVRLSNVTPSLSTVDCVSDLSSVTTSAHLPSALNTMNYSSAPHYHLPENEVEEVQGSSMFSMVHRTAPGSRGHSWFLQVGIKYLDDQDSKTTLLLGLSSLTDILPGATEGFALHPPDERSSLPVLTSNRIEDGFPGLAVLAFKYFLVRDKRNRAVQQTVPPSSQPSPHG
jgi:hypothetical protein